MRPSAPLLLLLLLLALACAAAPERRVDRVVLVTIDTLRADHLSSYGYPRVTAPFLAELARRGVVFERALSASSHTGPSHASLFTGLFPYQHGLLLNGAALDEGIPVLAQSFAAAGYETGGFSSVGFLLGLERGFQRFVALQRHTAAFVPGAVTLDRALEWVAGRPADARYLLWLHLYDVHEWQEEDPVYERARVAVRAESPLSDAELERYLVEEQGLSRELFARRGTSLLAAIDRYDARIRYVDDLLARLYQQVPGPSLWVVTADHGEGLGQHGYAGHGRRLYQEQLHVPLLVHFSDDAFAGSRVSRPVRLVDVPATLAELTGVAWHAGEGRSFAALLADPDAAHGVEVEYSFAQRRPADEKEKWSGELYALQGHRYKYILASDGEDEFYDLSADPREAEPLADGPERRVLRQLLEERVSQARARKLPAIAPEHEDELRALGYIQ